MSNRAVLWTLIQAVVICAAPGAAQEKAASPRRMSVVILGASVSAGFVDPTSRGAEGQVNRSYRLDEPLKKIWPRSTARIVNYGDFLMFGEPEVRGKRQVEMARKRKPDLMIGVDFLTWFGYGRSRQRSEAGKVNEARLALQTKGLELLATLTCPMVLGDYPDMHGASSKMLPPSMIPNRATLAALNQKLRDWAAKRKNVYVFPLADFVKEAVGGDQIYPWGAGREMVLPKNFLLQADRLHANRVGALVLAMRATQACRKVLPEGHPLLRETVTLRGLVDEMGLEDAMPRPRPAKPTAPADPGRSGARPQPAKSGKTGRESDPN